jgi:hypothetical protein
VRVQSVETAARGEIKEGTVIDGSGSHIVPIRDFIPRFVNGPTYADSFGEQWNRYRAIQIDSENRLRLSVERFYRWTRWRSEMPQRGNCRAASGRH